DDRFGSGMVVFKGPADNANIVERQSFHLGAESSVFQGEVFAIKAAALWIQHQRMMGKTIIVYSDSRAALLAVNNSRVKSKLVLSTQRELCQASELNNVLLRWVKAHVGHSGNESADLLAKEGAAEQPVCDGAPKIPESMIKLRFKRTFDTYWQQRWDQRLDCRQTKQWMPQISKSSSFEILGLGRKPLSWLVQLITGHNFMKRHEALVNGTTDNECRLCLEDEETSFHCIAECPALARPRQEIFGTPFQTTPLQWSVTQVVSFVRETSIDSLLDPANIYGTAE
ncbi:MAG: ribonuclease H family protein, partial [Pseudomonadota bacterium]